MSSSKLLSKVPTALNAALPRVVGTRKELLRILHEIDVHKKSTMMTLTGVTSGLWAAAKYVAGEYASVTALLDGKEVPTSVDAGYALRLPQVLPPTYDVKSLFGLAEVNPVVYVLGQLNLERKNQPLVKAALPKVKTLHDLGRYFLSGPTNHKLGALLQFTAVEPVLSINGDLVRSMILPNQMESHLTSLGFSAYNTHFGSKVPAITAGHMTDPGYGYDAALAEHGHRNSGFKIVGLRPAAWRTNEADFRNIIWRKEGK